MLPRDLQREVGTALEGTGVLPGPIRHDPTGAAEFIDGNGQDWDVKSFRSDFPANRGGFDLETDMGKVEKELRSQHNVIVDTGRMTETDVEALRAEVARRGLNDKVVFWP